MPRLMCMGYQIAVLLALLAGMPTQAQTGTIDAEVFWALLRQTEARLEMALQSPDPAMATVPLRELWQNVRQVRTGDTVIGINVRWLVEPLTEGSPEALGELAKQVRALLDYHERQAVGDTDDGLTLAALDDVLRDARFQYADVTPTPLPELPDFPSLAPPPIPSGLSQAILAVAATAAIILVVTYFARSLQTQRTALEAPASGEQPATASGARDLAAELAAASDYRGAIRYLYLSSLLLLDERGLIHYDATLTNREHLRQVKNRPQLADLLRRMVNVFEDVWYGYAPVDEAMYQQYRQQIDQLQRIMP